MEVRTVLLVAAAIAALAWLAVAVFTLVGRIVYERRSARASGRRDQALRRPDRLVRQAARHRGESSKWRRVAALRTLARAGHPRTRALLRRALRDSDPDVAGAAVRALGETGESWAVDALFEALENAQGSRSRVAVQLESLLPNVAPRLVPLLSDSDPAVRFWAATLLADVPGVGSAQLLACTQDRDPNVRAAAVEAIGGRRERSALPAVRARLADEAWFVRVHACRALGQIGDADEAPRLARALGDPWWWVRAAAKEALRGYGIAAAGAVIPYLDDEDEFARNGAAEVLQDLQLVDMLALSGSERRLLERILAAGGPSMRDAAEHRSRETIAPEVRAG